MCVSSQLFLGKPTGDDIPVGRIYHLPAERIAAIIAAAATALSVRLTWGLGGRGGRGGLGGRRITGGAGGRWVWWIAGPRRGGAASEVCGAAIRQAVEVMSKDKVREMIFLVIGQLPPSQDCECSTRRIVKTKAIACNKVVNRF